MSNPLPVGKFHFLPQPEIDTFDLMSIPPDNDTRYIIDCDITNPDHLHPWHNDCPMAPEHMTVDAEMLSAFAKRSMAKGWKPTKKLTPNLSDKTNYVCHYRNLHFYVNHGLIVTNIHRILAFHQSRCLKP